MSLHAARLAPLPASPVEPGPETPVLVNVAIRDHVPPGDISVFADMRWHLYPMNLNPTQRTDPIVFSGMPPTLVDAVKRYAWALINQELPDTGLTHLRMRRRLTAWTVHGEIGSNLRPFVVWLAQRDRHSFADATADDLVAYRRSVQASPARRQYKFNLLSAVTRLWLFGPLLRPEDRLRMPDWESADLADVLGPAGRGENLSAPIDPATMSPLLVWSLRFVQRFAPDIIAGVQERQRIRATVPDAAADSVGRVHAYAAGLRASGLPLPSAVLKRSQRPRLAIEFIAGSLGVGRGRVRRHLFAGVPLGPCAPLELKISATIDPDGGPWVSAIDYYDAAEMAERLATASFIVIAYLSGMRPAEVLALRRGCCVARPIDHGAVRHEITGSTFKAVLDEDGNTRAEGEVRDHPWFVIQPVAQAIAVMEALSGEELLFPRQLFMEFRRVNHVPGSAAEVRRTTAAIGDFIEWVNSYAVTAGRPTEVIPPDPGGRVTAARFRRTLAWFIYRLPGGRIALGVQYGHIRLPTSEGYGARAAAGLGAVLATEEALAIADRLTAAAERLHDGEGVSGPAKHRYLAGVSAFEQRFGGVVLTRRQGALLRGDPKLRIYDNGEQPLACCYNATTALCHPDRASDRAARQTPDLTRCDSRCANIARTDGHAGQLAAAARELRDQANAKLCPEPLRLRLEGRAATCETLVDRHASDRVTVTSPGHHAVGGAEIPPSTSVGSAT